MKGIWHYLCIGAIVLSLCLAPFVTKENPIYETSKITWTKNPIKKIKNYATGIEADVFHVTLREDACIIVLDAVECWDNSNVYPIAYFHDPIFDHWKVVFLPVSDKATAFLLDIAENEFGAKWKAIFRFFQITGGGMVIEIPVKKVPPEPNC